MDDRIKKIADHYGFEAQSRQLMEEMGELAQAVNKLWRFDQGYIDGDRYALVENVAKEIADVNIMAYQIAYLTNCENLAKDLIDQILDDMVTKISKPEKMVTVIGGIHGIHYHKEYKTYYWRVESDDEFKPGDLAVVYARNRIECVLVMEVKDVPVSVAKQYSKAVAKVVFK